MSAVANIKDFAAWFTEVLEGSTSDRPPPTALGVRGGEAAFLRWTGEGYAIERPAQAGDAAPLALGDGEALTARIKVVGAGALHGAGAARIEAAKQCPFALSDAHWALRRSPEAWTDGAPWLFAAAPRAKAESAQEILKAAGAKPGAAFAICEGAPVFLDAPSGRGAMRIAAGVAAIAILSAVVSTNFGAARIETAAETRLTEARRALDLAETKAANAAAAREIAQAPLRSAAAAETMLRAAPPAAAALAALARETPDGAYARTLAIAPDVIRGEFVAPDAAALAATLGQAVAFSSARVATAARTDPATGLQRATLEIAPRDAEAGK